MIRSSRFSNVTFVAALLAALVVCSHEAQADRLIKVEGEGTGAYLPAQGYFFGPGNISPLGNLIFSGTLELKEMGGGRFRFQNAGRGTASEQFQETIYEDGSTISYRFRGVVQLIPLSSDQFTAEWNGRFTVASGTGRFRGASGQFEVTATNDPFQLTDPQWTFLWTWVGRLELQDDQDEQDDCLTLALQTGGLGEFDPANLGLGDPASFPFPLIIGDGSGEGIYDGTPTGNEFRLNGHLVGDGFDQHYGLSQAISPGIPTPAGTIWYPVESGPNPNGSGLPIHIMDTRIGEIWFEYKGYFELDFVAGTIVGVADFRAVGGTDFFEGARGSVFVRVVSNLEDVTGLPYDPAAPFRYDFQGYIDVFCDDDHQGDNDA